MTLLHASWHKARPLVAIPGLGADLRTAAEDRDEMGRQRTPGVGRGSLSGALALPNEQAVQALPDGVRVVPAIGARRCVVDVDRVHRVVSDDGTEIAGGVRGQGPPLVVVHGGLGDGNPDASFMLPFLVDHFTCYVMAGRGRGMSADNADHSRERVFEDVAAFVEGIGEPASVFGHSGGAFGVLGGAARAPAAFRAVALYEPPLPGAGPLASEELLLRLRSTIAEDRLTDAFWMFVDNIIVPTEEERMIFSASVVAEMMTPIMPVVVHDMSDATRPMDTESLEHLNMPALFMQGTRSADHFKDSVRILAAKLTHTHLVEIAGAGHMGPVTHAEAVAGAVTSFFRGATR